MNKEKLNGYLKAFFRSFAWLFIFLLVLDIITKQIVLAAEVNPGSVIADWGIVRISFILNYNAAFGIGFENRLMSRVSYLIVASLISIGIVSYLVIKRKETNLLIRLAFVLIVTGALGNMIDRIFYSPEYAVVDWIDFYWIWPFVFNVADCCIVIGTVTLLVYTIVLEVKDMIANRNKTAPNEKVLSASEKERLNKDISEEKDT